MQWKQVDRHYIESDQKYRIPKGRNENGGTTYAPHTPDGKPLAYVSTVDEAKQICETHFHNRSTTP